MNKISLLLATALLIPACDPKAEAGAEKPKADKQAKNEPKKDDGAKADAPPKKADDEEAKFQKRLDARVLADSGLGVGGKLAAFDIVNCDSGEEYCQVCRFGGDPKVMAVGSANDEAFKKDLKDLDAIAKKYKDKDLKAFAVVTDLADGKATTPSDPEAAQKIAKALKDELGIEMPVVVPAPKDGGPNKIWDRYYNITASRTVMFADGKNKVKWSAVGPDDWSKLNDAIVEVIGS